MTVAATELPPLGVSVKLIVPACTGSLKVAVTVVAAASPWRPKPGFPLTPLGSRGR